ncbi:MAG: hypothetical protein PUE12_10470 [Oscillospiraceae bacterium]|nr:hypothetical protein [Oscillospiraceae bacterium]
MENYYEINNISEEVRVTTVFNTFMYIDIFVQMTIPDKPNSKIKDR